MKKVGEYLQTLRNEKNVSLEEVAEKTGIRVQYLQALENGDYNKIPGDVFIKGFIRNYGNYLGVDGNGLVEAYIKENEQPAASAPAADQSSDTIVIHHPISSHDEEEGDGATKPLDPVPLADVPPVPPEPEEEPQPEIKPFIKELDDDDLADLENASEEENHGSFIERIKQFIDENLYEDVPDEEDDRGDGAFSGYAYQKEEEDGTKKGLGAYLNMKVFTVVFGVCLLIFCIVMGYFIFGGKTTPEIPATTSLSDSVKSENSNTRAAEKEEEKAQQTESTDTKTEKKEEKKGDTKTYGTATKGGVTVEITYNKPVWTQTSIDGKSVEAMTVPKGSTRVFNGKKSVRITFGSIRDVSIKVNGKDAPLKSTEWGTMTKTFTAK
jgi:cytoskeletal protein RodZ